MSRPRYTEASEQIHIFGYDSMTTICWSPEDQVIETLVASYIDMTCGISSVNFCLLLFSINLNQHLVLAITKNLLPLSEFCTRKLNYSGHYTYQGKPLCPDRF